MKRIEKMSRKLTNKFPNKWLTGLLTLFLFFLLFTVFDIETLKQIEIWNISAVANTVENIVPAGLISFFEKTVVKIVIYVAFGALVVLRILKFMLRRKAIVINHSSFSNAQSTYAEDVVDGCSVSQVDINLVSQVGQGKITDAIRVQDDAIKQILERCDENTELIYYGITHIPFIFRAGFQIGNEGKVRLLHKYRNEQACFKEISSEPDNYKIQLKDPEVANRGNGSNEMLVVIETSFPVKDDDLNVFQDKSIGYDIHFKLSNDSMYGFDTVASYDVINRLRTQIMGVIREAVKQHSIQRIHLVLATSSDFTFFLAQDFSRYHDPEVIAYQYERNDPRRYTWGISNIQHHKNAVYLTKQ